MTSAFVSTFIHIYHLITDNLAKTHVDQAVDRNANSKHLDERTELAWERKDPGEFRDLLNETNSGVRKKPRGDTYLAVAA